MVGVGRGIECWAVRDGLTPAAQEGLGRSDVLDMTLENSCYGPEMRSSAAPPDTIK